VEAAAVAATPEPTTAAAVAAATTTVAATTASAGRRVTGKRGDHRDTGQERERSSAFHVICFLRTVPRRCVIGTRLD
jgi:hypothetical protein